MAATADRKKTSRISRMVLRNVCSKVSVIRRAIIKMKVILSTMMARINTSTKITTDTDK